MNTPCIQEEDASLESINNDRNNEQLNSPHQQSDTVSNSSPRRASRVSNEDVVSGGISTNDILNHDYNQMKIEEGRIHRMNQKKFDNSRDDNDDIFVTQVTLNLDIIENRPHSGSTWKYNAIKRNNNFKFSNLTNNRPNTSRSHLSTDSKKTEPFLFLGTNRYSTNTSECSDHQMGTNHNHETHLNSQTLSQLSNRTKTKLSSRESSLSAYNNSLKSQSFAPNQQRVNFERSASVKKSRNTRNLNIQSKPVTFIEIVRSKSSADSASSIQSSETHHFQGVNKRNNARHNYSVADYNKFKNKLLKNHSRNYYQYDSINLNNNLLKNQGENSAENNKSNTNQGAHVNQLFGQGYSIISDSADISHKLPPQRQLSQIKSIYESIQRANNSKIFNLEMRRSNYLNNIRNTNNVLTSSLMVQKMVQKT